MGVEFIPPEFEVIRNENRCIACRVCERQCANEVHSFDEVLGMDSVQKMYSDTDAATNGLASLLTGALG